MDGEGFLEFDKFVMLRHTHNEPSFIKYCSIQLHERCFMSENLYKYYLFSPQIGTKCPTVPTILFLSSKRCYLIQCSTEINTEHLFYTCAILNIDNCWNVFFTFSHKNKDCICSVCLSATFARR